LQFEKEDDNVVASALQKPTTQLQFEKEDNNVVASCVTKDNNVFAASKKR